MARTSDPYAVFDEHQIQCALMRAYAKRRMAATMLFAIPNGGARDKVTAKRLKDEGARAGANDLVAIREGSVYFVEVKTLNGQLSKVQRGFHADIAEAGGNSVTVYGYIDAINTLEALGIIRPPLYGGVDEPHS